MRSQIDPETISPLNIPPIVRRTRVPSSAVALRSFGDGAVERGLPHPDIASTVVQDEPHAATCARLVGQIMVYQISPFPLLTDTV